MSVGRLFTDKCDRPHPDIALGKCRHSFRNTALSGRYPVRHTGNLASVRTYENTPDNEKKLPPFSFASQSRKREEYIYLQRLTKNLFQFKYGFRLYIFRRSSYNSLEFSRFCNPFMLLVIKKLKDDLSIVKETVLVSPAASLTLQKPFNSFSGRESELFYHKYKAERFLLLLSCLHW